METECIVLKQNQEEHDSVIQRYLDEISEKVKHIAAIEQQLAIVRKKLRGLEN